MQIGTEPSPDCGTQGQAQCGGCFVCSMVGVFREVYRVLRDDGTCWLNLGDTYGGRGNTMGGQVGGNSGKRAELRRQYDDATFSGTTNLPSGNLVGVPWRVALALQANGWVLRQDIIWAKPNPMPESVTDRCTKSHEHIFLLAKGEGYYYDIEPIREDVKGIFNGHITQVVDGFRGESRQRGRVVAVQPHGDHVKERGHRDQEMRGYATVCGANKRDVWTIPTRGYPGAHYAVFPQELITPCILAGTSEYGCCSVCGVPWERVVSKSGGQVSKADDDTRDRSFNWSRNGKPGTGSTLDGKPATRTTVGWRRMCVCRTGDVVPAVVLDPFVGSGTTVATAIALGRVGIGIDLSEVYLRENAVPRVQAAMRGEKVARSAVPMSVASPPPAKKMHGT